jgi:hypothetical protein
VIVPPDSAIHALPGSPREHVLLPCSEACAAFRPLKADRWSEFGVCGNPRSRFSGYPVRTGRDCRSFRVSGRVDFTRAT